LFLDVIISKYLKDPFLETDTKRLKAKKLWR